MFSCPNPDLVRQITVYNTQNDLRNDYYNDQAVECQSRASRKRLRYHELKYTD